MEINRGSSSHAFVTMLLIFSISLITCKVTWGGTPLGDIAASLQPGQWAEVKANNQVTNGTSIFSTPENGGSILEYAGKGVWDPVSRQFLFLGASHAGSFVTKFVRYSASTNSWTALAPPPFQTAHAYDHQATNQGIYYHRQYNGTDVRTYNIADGTWGLLPDFLNLIGYRQVAGSLEFFPELGPSGSLIFFDGDWGVLRYNLSSNQWSLVTRTNASSSGVKMGPYHNVSAYSRVHKLIIFGGGNDSTDPNTGQWQQGSRMFYKLDSTGTVKKLPTAPVSIGVWGIGKGYLVPDPVSGNFIALGPDGSQWLLDPINETWNALNAPPPPFLESLDFITFAPIPDYGVIFFTTPKSVYLYKPNFGGTVAAPPPLPSDTSAPSVPTGLVGSAPSSSQISLFWNASTDNVGVAGYRLYRDGVQVATVSATAYQDNGLAPATQYTYAVAAYDVAGNLSGQSAQASATTQATATIEASPTTQASATTLTASIVSSDFQTRCAAPDVIKCVGFDQPSEIGGTYGDTSGTLPGNARPEIDPSVKASGNSSLKFTIPSNSAANSSGSYFTNFSPDLSVQFAENSEFYLQWRQRFSTEFLTSNYQGGGGWKQAIIGTGDKPGCTSSTSTVFCYSSCTALELVVQNTYHRGFAQMYNSCTGSASHGPYDPFQEPLPPYDFKLQNARPSPYCLYSQQHTGAFFPPAGNCVGYFANEWMTFQVHVKLGPRVGNEFTNSYVQLWIAREGKPSEQAFNWGPYNLSAGSPTENQKYGKIWLLPYNTGKDPGKTYPTAYTWYDELIISRQRIADPSVLTTAQSPNPPSTLSVK
jgi:hypothetical protein